MFETILFPADGSDGATHAFEHVLDLADTFGASIHLVHVVHTTSDPVSYIEADVSTELESRGEEIVGRLADRARDRGIATETAVLDGKPYRAVVDYAVDRDPDLVAMPTHARKGLERYLIGSTTARVLRRSEVPVVAIPPDLDLDRYPYENVLFPTDGSDCANAALEAGIGVTEATDAHLHVLSVVDAASLGLEVRSFATVDPIEDRANEAVVTAAERAREAGLSVSERIESGSTVHGTISAYVDEHEVDLVVMGTHGRTGFDRHLLGSVTEKLVRTSPVPVLTVRGPSTPN